MSLRCQDTHESVELGGCKVGLGFNAEVVIVVVELLDVDVMVVVMTGGAVNMVDPSGPVIVTDTTVERVDLV